MTSGPAPVLIRLSPSAAVLATTYPSVVSPGAEGLPEVSLALKTVPADDRPLSEEPAAVLYPAPGSLPGPEENSIRPIPEADAAKYVPETENYCKIMVNGQEPDFRGVRAVNKNGSIWGNVLCILERMRVMAPDRVDYTWEPETGTLTLRSGGRTAVARTGYTHLLVDGQENLMDGQPYVTPEGILVMEVNAIAPYVSGAAVQYDDRIGALRITL